MALTPEQQARKKELLRRKEERESAKPLSTLVKAEKKQAQERMAAEKKETEESLAGNKIETAAKIGLGGLAGRAVGKTISKIMPKTKEKTEEEINKESEKLKKIVYCGWFIYAIPLIVNAIGFELNRSLLFFLNLGLIMYALIPLNVYAFVAGVLSFWHTEIFAAFGLATNRFLLPIYWPWWVLFALFYKWKQEQTKLVALSRLALVYFIVFGLVMMGLTQTIAQVGQTEEVEEIKQEQQESAWEEFARIAKCTINPGEEGYESCMNPQEEREEEQFKGATSKKINQNKIEIKAPKQLTQFGQIELKDAAGKVQASMEYEVNENINAGLSCYFERKGEPRIKGIIDKTEIILFKDEDKATLFCQPSKPLENKVYNVHFVVNVDDMTTESILRRIFIGSMTDNKIKQELIDRYILNTYPDAEKAGSYVSVAPENDFVVPSILMGNTDIESGTISNRKQKNGMIEMDSTYVVVNNIDGKITKIKEIEMTLAEGIKPVEGECTKFRYDEESNKLYLKEENIAGDFSGVGKNDIALFTTCKLYIDETEGQYLIEPEGDYEVKDFLGRVRYSYKYDETFKIKVNVPVVS